ncbi:hypothetical protein BFJ63_vAg16183 [Fusarium oxysporum f. sp. narcissi]|uniref:Uncharacterized protein n=1 Tax=Fusarium oxysporum f. sp. narcissi TaxID=451672 RepID=A0A4Q2V1W3_FUSOX|nr:hypothetical protein FOWG_18201 [Fusarium oxysporum f. sp. lycopersici MN25]RYC80925.1 hypothetical protein BFJ63_vAg16183 [Fusarium oxysporum f. sp. narcissi]
MDPGTQGISKDRLAAAGWKLETFGEFTGGLQVKFLVLHAKNFSYQTPLISTAQYAPALPSQVQSDDSFHTRGSSASIATEQRRLNSPGAPTSDSHDGCNAQTSRELEVTRPKGDWYKKLPEDLIACLEKYQQDNNLSLGIDGLRIQPGNYVCPFCIESKRKLYKRPSHFSNHLASHWAALKKH